MSKEAIIDKIISDAELKAESIISDAQKKADENMALVNAECEEYRKKFKGETDAITAELLAKSETVAELDVKKMMLGAKAQIIDKVFERVLEKLRNLDKDTYLKLLVGMLKYAEDGDIITISKREADILTKDVIADFANEKGIKLTLAKKLGDFDGGMILSNKGVDKNLTFDVEVSILREEIEMQIAKELFN